MLTSLLLLTGCIQVHRPSCETTTRDLDEDERVAEIAVSAADLMTLMTGEFGFAGEWPEDGPVSGTTTVARGDGAATGVESIRVDTVTKGGFGFGQEVLLIDVQCVSSISVPVDITLQTTDGAVDVAVPGLAAADDQAGLTDGVPEFMFAGATFTGDTVTAIPAPADPDATAGLELQFTPTAFDFVSLWWDGSDYEQIFQAPAAD